MLSVRRFGRGPTLVALHGFSMTGDQFRELARPLGHAILAPDLPGHGRSAHEDCAIDEVIEEVAALLPDAPIAPLLGYSQGARVALLVAHARPASIESLVLVSGNAGVRDPAERERRFAEDDARAERILSSPLDDFIDEWTAQPLTSTEGWSESDQDADRQMRQQNTTRGLARALRGYGQGVQPNLWPELGTMTVPTLVVSGEFDTKYTAIGEELTAALPTAEMVVVEGAGHNVLGDEPERAARAIRSFLERNRRAT